MKIPRDSWDIIQKIIRRYPEQKSEYDAAIEEMMDGTPHGDGQPGGNLPGNPVECLVMAMNSPRMMRMKREIEAVKRVYEALNEDHKKVIRVRFWSNRYKNMPYLWMERCVSYREAQLRRICGKFIKNVGMELGEIPQSGER